MTRSAKATNNLPGRYRWQIAVRVMVAVLGGYILANVSSILLSFIPPMTRSDAVMTSMLLSFALYAAAVLWVFSVRSVHKAWLGLIAPSILLSAFAALTRLTGIAG